MSSFQIVHKWVPCHREVLRRSHVDKTIVLLRIGERYVPIVETAVEEVNEDKAEDASSRKGSASNSSVTIAAPSGEQREGPAPPSLTQKQ